MNHKLRVLSLSAAWLGILLVCATTACAQVVADIDVTNQNEFPIRLKRIGSLDGDVASANIDQSTQMTFPGVPFKGDQVFIAWSVDGKFVGTVTLTVETATRLNPVLLVTKAGIFVEARSKVPNSDGNSPRPEGNALFAQKLGIHYQKVPRPRGKFGAKLTSNPEPNSPAAGLGFEIGDTIIAMDDHPFTKPSDLDNHFANTTVLFIDVRTGQEKMLEIVLP